MRSNYHRKYQALTKRELPLPVQFVLLGLALLIAFASSASAQNVTEINTPTTTTLWAGRQDWATFGLSSVTSPTSGVILQGTAISQFTGKPVPAFAYGDSSNGLCRVDPEVDDLIVSSTPGIGAHNKCWLRCRQTDSRIGQTNDV